MSRDNRQTETPSDAATNGPESPERRELLRRLAKGGAALPAAAVVFTASKAVAVSCP